MKHGKSHNGALWFLMQNLQLFDLSANSELNKSHRTNKVQPCSSIYYSSVSELLNMFWATHRPSSGAQKL